MAINVALKHDPTNGQPVITITLDHEAISDLAYAHLGGKPNPLLIIASQALPIKVDAVRYEFLCASPGAQRFVIDDSTHGVLIDGVTYHCAD